MQQKDKPKIFMRDGLHQQSIVDVKNITRGPQ